MSIAAKYDIKSTGKRRRRREMEGMMDEKKTTGRDTMQRRMFLARLFVQAKCGILARMH